MAADVKIDIAAEFTGKKAFKQADTATEKLTKNVKKLAGAVGIAYGTSAVIAYGKASVKAFAADEAAAVRLNRAVENLGIGFANPAIADYIGKLEKSAAIADDILRPAFQSLLTTTGSLTKSQELLNNAIQISRASGVDLSTVTEDLSKGYVGITRGLAKYNTGLTRAELNTKSFSEILGVLLTRSAGAAEDYLTTTSYKMDVLAIATGNASEIIGEGLVEAFARIGGGTEASDAQIAIEGIAKAISGITIATGTALGGLTNVFRTLKNLPKNIFQGFAGVQGGVNLGSVTPTPKLTLSQQKQQEALKAMEAAAIKRNKELLALKTKQLAIEKQTLSQKKLQAAIDKANLALNKGSEIFDMDQIQIAAALTSQAEQLAKTTNGAQVLQIANDTARLNVKRSILDLENAIASKDEAQIIAATKKLNADLQSLSVLTGQEVKLTQIKSILDSLNNKSIGVDVNTTEALNKIRALYSAASQGIVIPVSLSGTAASVSTGDTSNAVNIGGLYTAIGENFKEYLVQTGALTSGISPNGREYNYSITVNTGIGDPNAIADEIVNFLNSAAARGTLSNGILNIG